MKRNFSLWILLAVLLGISLSCTREDGVPDIIDSDILTLNYTVSGAEKADLTRGVTGTTDENRVSSIYTLFFEDGGTNDYIGCMVSAANSSGNQSSGSSRVGVPGGRDINDAFKLIVIANLEGFMSKGSEPTIADYLDNVLLAGKTRTEALDLLQGHFTDAGGIQPSLLMSTTIDKPLNSKSISIEFARVVCRVDVNNQSTTPFRLVSAEVWNARDDAYIVNRGSATPQVGGYSHYKNNVQTTTGTTIEGGLYFFPNVSMAPVLNDNVTTCLIIGGEYNNSGKVTYYRVNICAAGQMQVLDRNHIYTIKITDVLNPGGDDKDDAYNDTDVRIEYVVNDWDDEYNGGLVSDKDGNRMALSQRQLVFSEMAGQSIEIDVLLWPAEGAGALDPSTWSVGGLTGTNAASRFQVEKSEATKIKVTTLMTNATSSDWKAVFEVYWGTMKIEVSITQIGQFSTISGIRAVPASLWFENEPTPASPTETKQVGIDMRGNFAGVDENNISFSVLYSGTGQGLTGWIRSVSFAMENAGVFYYDIEVENLDPDAYFPSVVYRHAELKFAVTDGDKAMTCKADVVQSAYNTGEDGFIRTVSMVMHQRAGGEDDAPTYTAGEAMVKNPQDASTPNTRNFRGLLASQTAATDLHFALNDKQELIYCLKIQSSVPWEISALGDLMGKMTFMDGEGNPYTSDDARPTQMVEVWIRAKTDMIEQSSSQNAASWAGPITLNFEDGTTYTWTCFQTKVFAKFPADQLYYAYETVPLLDGSVWLDRNLGATSNDAWDNYKQLGDAEAMGQRLTPNVAATACPKGFRLPYNNGTTHSGKEAHWLASQLTRNTTDGRWGVPNGQDGQGIPVFHYFSTPLTWNTNYYDSYGAALYLCNGAENCLGLDVSYITGPNGSYVPNPGNAVGMGIIMWRNNYTTISIALRPGSASALGAAATAASYFRDWWSEGAASGTFVNAGSTNTAAQAKGLANWKAYGTVYVRCVQDK